MSDKKKKVQEILDEASDRMIKSMTDEQDKIARAPKGKHGPKGNRDDVNPADADKHLE